MTAAPDSATARLFEAASAALSAEPTLAWFVPGRIEFLGKHTDYAGGRSLVCAVQQGLCMVARPRRDRILSVKLVDGRSTEFPLCSTLQPTIGSWANYPMTVARRVAANFPGDLHGIDMALASDLPPAAGLSSSSALIVGTFLLLSDANGLQSRDEFRRDIVSTEQLCAYLGAIENGKTYGTLAGDGGVGTFGGSEDHTAIVMSQADHLSQFSFHPLRKESAHRLPHAFEFVIGSSGVMAEKTGEAREKYNRLSRAVAIMLNEWHKHGEIAVASLAEAVRSTPDAVSRLAWILKQSTVSDFSPTHLIGRLEQFVSESERIIPQASIALDENRLSALGDLVNESQTGAEIFLSNQVPETIALAASARRLGAAAATAFGAGFGGSVWALVKSDQASAFRAEWADRYMHQFPAASANARFFQSKAGPAAVRLLQQSDVLDNRRA